MAALKGGRFCFSHDPAMARARGAARRRGGRHRRIGYARTPARCATVADLQAITAQVLADVLLQPNTEARGRTVARLILVAAKLIEDGDLTARVEALEARVRMHR